MGFAIALSNRLERDGLLVRSILPTSASNLSPLTLDGQKANSRLSVGRNNQAIPLRLLLDDTLRKIPQVAEGRRLQGKVPQG